VLGGQLRFDLAGAGFDHYRGLLPRRRPQPFFRCLCTLFSVWFWRWWGSARARAATAAAVAVAGAAAEPALVVGERAGVGPHGHLPRLRCRRQNGGKRGAFSLIEQHAFAVVLPLNTFSISKNDIVFWRSDSADNVCGVFRSNNVLLSLMASCDSGHSVAHVRLATRALGNRALPENLDSNLVLAASLVGRRRSAVRSERNQITETGENGCFASRLRCLVFDSTLLSLSTAKVCSKSRFPFHPSFLMRQIGFLFHLPLSSKQLSGGRHAAAHPRKRRPEPCVVLVGRTRGAQRPCGHLALLQPNLQRYNTPTECSWGKILVICLLLLLLCCWCCCDFVVDSND